MKIKLYVSIVMKFQEPDQSSEISWSLGKGKQNKQLSEIWNI